MKYGKPFLTFSEQLDLAISRGMQVIDRDMALSTLRRIGYYRLSAYWYHWRIQDGIAGDERYTPDASFEDALAIYSFDRQLRLILLDAIERFEVALRIAISNVAGKRDPFIYQSSEHLAERAQRMDKHEGLSAFELFSSRCRDAYNRSSEDFVKHCRVKYENGPALWVHIETWDFGLLSNFYKLLLAEDRLEVSQYFNIDRYDMFESWIASLNYVRNLCAHHSRFFRRTLVVQPGTRDMRLIDELAHVRKLNPQRKGKIYPILTILLHLMDEISPESSWGQRLIALIDSFPQTPTTSLADYGFSDEWRMQDIWLRAI